jgi:steroid delta-isomerase-like uncharacterized protein
MTDNKIIARRYFTEIMNMASMKTLYEILSPDFIFTLATHPEPFRGPDGFKELVTMLHTAFPDFYIHVQDMVGSGDTVVSRWRGGGTHTGGALKTVAGDIPPSGKRFEIDGMTWHRIVDGKIVESLANEDTVGLMMQLGVILSQPATEPSPEENMKLAKRYFDEVMNQGKVEIIEELVDPNFAFIIPTQPAPFRGYEGFRGFVNYLRNGFPDIHFKVERIIADGNKVAARWKITGTHKGEFLGAQPTNKFVEDYGIDIFTILKGKILTVHVNENDFGLMKQLEIIK